MRSGCQAGAVKPDGIVLSGFDPKSTAQQVAQANSAGIPLIGWQAVDAPGPSTDPKLFSNVTTRVQDVAKISADWVISQSNGRAGVVVFTDASIPFAKGKSDLIEKELATCSDVKVLTTSNIPIADASNRTPQEVSALLSRFGTKWTNSAAVNDLYFADAAPSLRAAGKRGNGATFNIGAGDGDPSAFQRINSKQFQTATVPEPLSEQGWQMVDEFNRAFAGKPASGYVAPVHITTADNSGGTSSWDPKGYREAYQKLWGKYPPSGFGATRCTGGAREGEGQGPGHFEDSLGGVLLRLPARLRDRQTVDALGTPQATALRGRARCTSTSWWHRTP